ncbi:translation elongation factor Ts [Myxococcota bacterium]|nr:translation elongation factor Ts [Myxococcota bacterium]
MAEVSAGDVKALRDSTGAGMMDCKRALADAAGDVERARELLRERGLAKAGKRAGRETSEGAVVFASKGGKGALIELGCETDFVAKTPDFQGLAQSIAEACLQASGVADAEKALALKLSGGTVDEVIKAAVAKVGENIQLKRVASVEVKGVTGGYVHGGGKLGVLIALETGLSGGDVEAVARDVAMHVAAHDPTPIAVDRADVPASIVEKERKILTAQAMESGKPANVVEKMVDGRMNKFFSENCLLAQGFVKDPDTSIRDLLAKAGKASGGTLTIKSFVRFKLGEAAS